jgi:hypothetical protein
MSDRNESADETLDPQQSAMGVEGQRKVQATNPTPDEDPQQTAMGASAQERVGDSSDDGD